jgi:hypothetical protein
MKPPCCRPSIMRGEYGYKLTKDVPMRDPAWKASVPFSCARIRESGTGEILSESADAQIAKDP